MVTRIKKMNEGVVLQNAVALLATPVFLETLGKEDLLIFRNTGASAVTVTILQGNGLQGTSDLEIAVAGSKNVALRPESGKFKNVTGENKGKIGIKASATGVGVEVLSF